MQPAKIVIITLGIVVVVIIIIIIIIILIAIVTVIIVVVIKIAVIMLIAMLITTIILINTRRFAGVGIRSCFWGPQVVWIVRVIVLSRAITVIKMFIIASRYAGLESKAND